jgi:16S rRNA (guanine527-N7)-methyltransferase
MSAIDTLKKGIAALGLDLPADAPERLLAFGHLLIKWNKVYNLTAIRDEAQVITHHLLDSLSVLPHLAGVNRLVDVGSGGGLPGVVLALCRPDLQVDSVETVQKKATFQNQAKIELKLGNFRAHHARIENWHHFPRFCRSGRLCKPHSPPGRTGNPPPRHEGRVPCR